MAKAIGYALNQRVALERFLEDGRLPLHNNGSEQALRREVIGRNYAESGIMRSNEMLGVGVRPRCSA
jgi:hypothetical protein